MLAVFCIPGFSVAINYGVMSNCRAKYIRLWYFILYISYLVSKSGGVLHYSNRTIYQKEIKQICVNQIIKEITEITCTLAKRLGSLFPPLTFSWIHWKISDFRPRSLGHAPYMVWCGRNICSAFLLSRFAPKV